MPNITHIRNIEIERIFKEPHLMFKHRNTEFYIYFGFKVKRACIQCVVPSIQRNASEPGNCAMFVIGQQKSVCNIFGFLAL